MGKRKSEVESGEQGVQGQRGFQSQRSPEGRTRQRRRPQRQEVRRNNSLRRTTCVSVGREPKVPVARAGLCDQPFGPCSFVVTCESSMDACARDCTMTSVSNALDEHAWVSGFEFWNSSSCVMLDGLADLVGPELALALARVDFARAGSGIRLRCRACGP